MEGVWSEYPIEVIWEGEKRFRGGKPGGPALLVDGDRQVGPSPVEAMIVALGSCSAIDIVEILEKRRTPVRRMDVRVEFARAASPPRRLTGARVHFRIASDTDLLHAERAAELSFTKYCSVSTSLAPDIDLTWTVEIDGPAGEAQG